MTSTDALPQPREVSSASTAERPAFSICTLVTRRAEYDEMLATFLRCGFGEGDCEYLFIDNSEGNRHDTYSGTARFLAEARGHYVILCHQDVLLLDDDRGVLEARLEALTRLDPNWGLCGNAGGNRMGENYVRISDPHGDDRTVGPLPARVMSLDENFILVRREAGLAVSGDLSGFHLMGTDLCVLASVIGRSAWVIDFHLRHKSGGRLNADYWAAKSALTTKYREAFTPRWMNAMCSDLVLGRPVPPVRLMADTALRGIWRVRRLMTGENS